MCNCEPNYFAFNRKNARNNSACAYFCFCDYISTDLCRPFLRQMDNRRPVWGLCWLLEKLSTFEVQYDLVRQVVKKHIDMFNVFPHLCLTEGPLIVQYYMQTVHCLFSFVELPIGVFLTTSNAEVSTKRYMKSADKVHVLLIFSNWARLENRTFCCCLQCNRKWYQLTAGAEFPIQSFPF